MKEEVIIQQINLDHLHSLFFWIGTESFKLTHFNLGMQWILRFSQYPQILYYLYRNLLVFGKINL